MADQEKKELNTENLEATELEDQNLEDVSGGNEAFRSIDDVSNSGCPTNVNCPC